MASVAPELPALARDRAFETLYRQYVKDVYHYALALLRNPADAEDVTQTTFMNAYRAFKRGEEVRKPQHWLIKIAHNVARSRYARASRRVKEVPLDDHLTQLAVPDSEKPDVEAVLDALALLPLNQRAALVMRELEGRTYAEIADTIGVSVPAVETLIFRARRSLRLKASSIRVLGVVPVPTSLTQLFGAGAGVVGGGGAAGGGLGLVFKAAVAVVAGAVATGIVDRKPSRSAVGSPGIPTRADAARTAAAEILSPRGTWAATIGAVGLKSVLVEQQPPAASAGPAISATQVAVGPAGGRGQATAVAAVTLPPTTTAAASGTAGSVVDTARSGAGTATGAVGSAGSAVTQTLPPLPTPPAVTPPAPPALPSLPPVVPPLP